MRKNCLVVGCAAIVLVIAFALLINGFLGQDPRFARTFAGIRNGMTGAQVEARFKPLHTCTVSYQAVRRDDPHAKDAPSARRYLYICSGHGWGYVFYLDASNRVVQKYKFLD